MITRNQPDYEYHAHPAIGSTTAKVGLQNEPLLHATLLGKVPPQEDKPCFVSGRLAHMAVLEPSRFRELVVTEGPINPRTGSPYGRDTKAFAEWQAENPHLTMVDPWIPAALDTMPAAVHKMMEEGEPELSVYQDLDGWQMKCRPDWINEKARKFWDLKSISTGGGSIERAIDKAIANRAYWFSSEWYKDALAREYQNPFNFELVFVEKEPPHRWRIVDLCWDYQQHGIAEVLRIQNIITTHHQQPAQERHSLMLENHEDLFHQSTAPSYLLWDEEGLD
jgi:hypothetical protein